MKAKLLKRNVIVLAVVMFLGVAVYLNWSYTQREGAAEAGEAAGAPVSVEADEAGLYYELEDSAQTSAAGADISEYFATARLTRQQARDSAIGVLREATELENATQEAIDGAVEEISVMAGYSLDEAEIETLIKAKGFDECVVFLGDDSATVAVPAPEEGLSSSAVSRITDIILSETGLNAEQIKIIEVK